MNAFTVTFLDALTGSVTTKTLQQLNWTQPQLTINSRAPSTFKAVAPADPAAASSFPYLTQITITDTTVGKVIFVGYRITIDGDIDGGRGQHVTYNFSDVMSRLMRVVYQIAWQITTNFGTTFVPVYSPRVWLFMNAGQGSWSYWNATAQLQAIIDYAQTVCGLPIQPGTIDPPIQMPVYPVQSLSCWECITKVIETLPDVSTALDFSHNPPRLNMRIRQNCTPITFPYKGYGHKSSRIKAREDLQVPQVVIKYQTNVSGQNIVTTDAYPPGSQGLTDNCAVQGFDLQGGQQGTVFGTVTSVPTDPTDSTTEANGKYFWQNVKPDLARSDITGLTVESGSVTVVDSTGDTVALASYPNRIISGQVAAWMQNSSGVSIVAKEVTISALVNYTKLSTADGTNPQNVVTQHPVSCRVKLTNSAAGTVNYKALASSVAPELPPTNFAYLFWCAQNNVAVNYVGGVATPPASVPSILNPHNLQYEGWHEITGGITAYYDCTNTLNLSGGNSAWASMNATIYSIEYDLEKGRTRFNFGPHKTLSIGEYYMLLMMARTRIAWDNPNIPSSGLNSARAGVTLPTDDAKENTVEHVTPTSSLMSTQGPVDSGTYWTHTFDAGSSASGFDEFPAHVMQVKNASGGGTTAGEVQYLAFMSQVYPGGVPLESGGIVFKFKCITGCDSSGNPIYRYLVASQQFSGTPPAGADTT